MEKLINPQKTIEVIREHGFDFQKKFGQNFLIDQHVVDRIMDAAELTREDCVVEIGPGIGTLTQFMAERAGRVVAIEIDRNLIPILGKTLAEYDNVTVINADVLETDLNEIARTYGGGRRVKVVANLPYYITTPIIMALLEKKVPIESITVMVQKEVAMRMQAGPGSKDYGALSLAVGYYAQAQLDANVPPNCFIPRPKVGSAVITLKVYENPPVQPRDEAFMFRLIKTSFAQRRKTLMNGLRNSSELTLTKEQILEGLSRLGKSESVRGETLTLEEFAKLSDILQDILAEG
ncbi:MAG: 16S rRNA (adenine(1518)-N(6)/adenine(1519)-N(6))-dimethyltransferase RsmA [Lachnospiraceae bacterium]|nr:16S rRNA (adenine(1518)-N(6)/adenine(1519)-N(6))-dimethyltransferase RsmA [Lachnospiraceae bacterium]